MNAIGKSAAIDSTVDPAVDPGMAQFVEHILAGSQLAKKLGVRLRALEPERVFMGRPYVGPNYTDAPTGIAGGYAPFF